MLTNATGTHATTVDADGHATWFEMALGSLTISEAILDGYGEPVVFCRLEPLEPRDSDAMRTYGEVAGRSRCSPGTVLSSRFPKLLS